MSVHWTVKGAPNHVLGMGVGGWRRFEKASRREDSQIDAERYKGYRGLDEDGFGEKNLIEEKANVKPWY